MLEADLNSIKVEIVRQILESSDAEILTSINKMLHHNSENEKAFFEPSSHVLNEIVMGKQQVQEGKTINWEDLRKQLR